MTNLFEQSMTTCRFIDTLHTPDGVGGNFTEYQDGAEFQAAITHNSTLQARIAEKEGTISTYTVSTFKGVGLKFNDYIRRLSDGQVFRITSNNQDQQTPRAASFQYEQVSAEATKLP